MTLSHAPATNCCFAVRGSRFTVHASPFTLHRSRFSAPSSELQAAGCSLQAKYFAMLFVDNLHSAFKYMRATAAAVRSHASQNKTDTRNY
jgi:hypothetical protein